MIPILKNKIKDKYSLAKLKTFETCTGEQRDIVFTLLLHAVLPPGGHSKNKVTKKTWKFSIADSQNSFIFKVNICNSYTELIEQRRNVYKNHDMHMQPFILIVSNEDFSDITSIQVVYDTIMYKFDSFIKALSCAFKIHYVFDLDYQKECYSVWELLQCKIFDISSSNVSTNVNNILSLLRT